MNEANEVAAVVTGRLLPESEVPAALTTMEQARALTLRQQVAEYRRQSRIYRRNGGWPLGLGKPETPEQEAVWAAKVAMWCVWYHLGEEAGRRKLAAGLREEHWALYMIDGLRQGQVEAGPEEMTYEVAQLRRQRAIVQAELARG